MSVDSDQEHLATLHRHLIGAFRASRIWQGCPGYVKADLDRTILTFRAWLLETQPESGLIQKLPTPVNRVDGKR